MGKEGLKDKLSPEIIKNNLQKVLVELGVNSKEKLLDNSLITSVADKVYNALPAIPVRALIHVTIKKEGFTALIFNIRDKMIELESTNLDWLNKQQLASMLQSNPTRRLDMDQNITDEKMDEARRLDEVGKSKESVAVLKEVAEFSESVEDRMLASSMIISITLHKILGGEPDVGTPEYAELRDYLRIALDSYDQSEASAREVFERLNDVDGFRTTLKLMDTNKPGKKVEMGILNEVEAMINVELGDQIALPYGASEHYDYSIADFCEKMVNKCDLAEQEAKNSKDILIRSNILKAQLYGNWIQMPGRQRGTHKLAVECYERALSLGGDEASIRYKMALMFRVHAGKSEAIENFKRVIQIEGDSELGAICAKELEKEKSKGGGCFIATAVYGSYSAPEVVILRNFRDQILAKSITGKIFIKFYYLISPSIAKFILNKKTLKNITQKMLTDHCVKYAEKLNIK